MKQLMSCCLPLLLWTGVVSAQSTNSVTVSGIVLSDSSERPIRDAEIRIEGGSSSAVGRIVRSDSAGLFVLPDLTPGPHRLSIRAVGYQVATIALDVPITGLDGLDVLLQPTTAELTRVSVRASSVPAHLRDFEERRKLGIGRFLDSTVLQAGGPNQWSQRLVEYMPNLRFEIVQGRRFFYNTRGPASFRNAKQLCYVRVIVDGILMSNGEEGAEMFDANAWGGAPIIAAEYYSPGELPPQFNRLGDQSCGALILWTRR